MAHETARKHRHLTHATSWKAGYTAPSTPSAKESKFPHMQGFKRPGPSKQQTGCSLKP